MHEGEALDGARRVLLYGVTGSGKMTAAARISAASGIPWTSVDELTWEAGWVPVSEEEQRRKVSEVCVRDVWLLDTAYGAWLDIPLANVELIVALDYPRWFSLQRLLRRSIARAYDKQPICNGNPRSAMRSRGCDGLLRSLGAPSSPFYAPSAVRLRHGTVWDPSNHGHRFCDRRVDKEMLSRDDTEIVEQPR